MNKKTIGIILIIIGFIVGYQMITSIGCPNVGTCNRFENLIIASLPAIVITLAGIIFFLKSRK